MILCHGLMRFFPALMISCDDLYETISLMEYQLLLLWIPSHTWPFRNSVENLGVGFVLQTVQPLTFHDWVICLPQVLPFVGLRRLHPAWRCDFVGKSQRGWQGKNENCWELGKSYIQRVSVSQIFLVEVCPQWYSSWWSSRWNLRILELRFSSHCLHDPPWEFWYHQNEIMLSKPLHELFIPFFGDNYLSWYKKSTPSPCSPVSPHAGGAASGFLASTFQRLRRLRGEKPVTLRNAIAKWMGISHVDINDI